MRNPAIGGQLEVLGAICPSATCHSMNFDAPVDDIEGVCLKGFRRIM